MVYLILMFGLAVWLMSRAATFYRDVFYHHSVKGPTK